MPAGACIGPDPHILGMNDRGNRYALATLKDKRATLASEVVQLESQLRARKDALGHVDASIEIGALHSVSGCSGKGSWGG